MKTLISSEKIEKVLITYDSINEWIEDNDKMIEQGWNDTGYNFFKNGKYYQEYSREIK